MTTKKLCITAMGIALFVVLSLCLQVPVFENYYLCLGYVSMMVFCFYFGPLSGMLVGSLGVVLYCLLIHGTRGDAGMGHRQPCDRMRGGSHLQMGTAYQKRMAQARRFRRRDHCVDSGGNPGR